LDIINHLLTYIRQGKQRLGVTILKCNSKKNEFIYNLIITAIHELESEHITSSNVYELSDDNSSSNDINLDLRIQSTLKNKDLNPDFIIFKVVLKKITLFLGKLILYCSAGQIACLSNFNYYFGFTCCLLITVIAFQLGFVSSFITLVYYHLASGITCGIMHTQFLQ
jgi:hypothetical protein